jgi:hypothetical protein
MLSGLGCKECHNPMLFTEVLQRELNRRIVKNKQTKDDTSEF